MSSMESDIGWIIREARIIGNKKINQIDYTPSLKMLISILPRPFPDHFKLTLVNRFSLSSDVDDSLS